jgi:hypothetical protein
MKSFTVGKNLQFGLSDDMLSPAKAANEVGLYAVLGGGGEYT